MHTTAGKLIKRSMRVTSQEPPIIAEEFVADKIERRRHMTAAVHICVETAAVVDQKSIQPILLTNKPEFFYRTGSNLITLATTRAPSRLSSAIRRRSRKNTIDELPARRDKAPEK